MYNAGQFTRTDRKLLLEIIVNSADNRSIMSGEIACNAT